MINNHNIKFKHVYRFIFIYILITTNFCGCASLLNKNRFIDYNDIKYKIDQARYLYDNGDIESAILILCRYIENNSYHHSHDQAYELVVLWLLQTNQIKKAKDIASFFLSNHSENRSAQNIINFLSDFSYMQSEHEH